MKMTFASIYFRTVRKELFWLCSIAAIALSIGVGIKTKFELSTTAAAIPLCILLTCAIILPSYLWEWRSVVRDEARKREVSFDAFVNSREYHDFLKRAAPSIIKKRLRL